MKFINRIMKWLNKKRGFGRELLETSGILLGALLIIQAIGWLITRQSVLGLRRILIALVVYWIFTFIYRIIELKLRKV